MPMELIEALRESWLRKRAVERAIAELEQLQSSAGSMARLRRPGRKSMEPQERRQVSDRMKRYWANRRGPRECSPPAETAQASPSRAYQEGRLRSA